MLDPDNPGVTAPNTTYFLDIADYAALRPDAATLAVLQHNGFSARLVRVPNLTLTPFQVLTLSYLAFQFGV